MQSTKVDFPEIPIPQCWGREWAPCLKYSPANAVVEFALSHCSGAHEVYIGPHEVVHFVALCYSVSITKFDKYKYVILKYTNYVKTEINSFVYAWSTMPFPSLGVSRQNRYTIWSMIIFG